MDVSELKRLLDGYEWNDVEFKEARTAVPKNAYETVSAFSNTAGGWLVFGVADEDDGYEVVGVIEVDKVQNDFLTVLHSGDKINRVISVKEGLVNDGENTLLVFHIPEARRQDKPVFLNGTITKSFIRRGGCDERCTEEDIKRFLRDASEERHDGETVEIDPEHCFDAESIRWYRSIYNNRASGTESMSDLEFLNHWGLVIEQNQRLLPTKASLLLFGTGAVLRQVLPRPVLDIQRIEADSGDELLDERWADRVVIEDNLILAWKTVVDRYRTYSEHPFDIDAGTLQRDATPPDYIAFRESAINLLIHQDYADHSRKASVKFFRDGTVIWNPGDAFASTDDLMEPGEKPVRNPRIVAAFRRVGWSEQAGTGLRAIFQNWQQLGNVPPIITNDKGRKLFELVLPKEMLLSEEQLLFQASLGVHLEESEAKAFAVACRTGELGIQDVRAVSGVSAVEAQSLLDRLVLQGIVTPQKSGDSSHVIVAEHLRDALKARVSGESLVSDQPPENPENLVTDQPPQDPNRSVSDQPKPLQSLTETQWQIAEQCDVPRTMADLMSDLGMTHRTFFRKTHLGPLVDGGVLDMTHPEQPNHPKQSYVLSEVGVELKARRMRESDANEPEKDE